jgi:hypothetical protein
MSGNEIDGELRDYKTERIHEEKLESHDLLLVLKLEHIVGQLSGWSVVRHPWI